MNTFEQRLRHVLGPRALTTWLRRIGSNTGQAGRIATGHVPAPELLTVMQRVENVSAAWLLDGAEPAYLVSPGDDDSAAERLRALAEEAGGWLAYWLTEPGPAPRAVLALRRAAQLQFRAARVDYTELHLLAGAAAGTCNTLAELATDGRIDQVLRLVTDKLAEVIAGRLGSFALCGEGEHPGALDRASPWRPVARLEDAAPARVADPPGAYSNPLARNVARLNAPHQRSVEHSVRALLEAEGQQWLD